MLKDSAGPTNTYTGAPPPLPLWGSPVMQVLWVPILERNSLGFGLSAAYFATVCVITIGTIALSISTAKPEKTRIRGLCIFGICLGYVGVSLFLVDIWGELMNRWCGQWPAFTLGIIFGIPVLFITAGTTLGILGFSLYAMISGRLPAWLESIPAPSMSTRLGLGLAVLLVLIVLGVSVLGIFVK